MMGALHLVETLLRWSGKALIALAALNLGAMMIHVAADVAAKYLFNSPLPGTAEIVAYYYMVAAVFLPLPLVELGNKAIAVDLFWNMFPGFVQRATLVAAYGLQTAFFVVLALQTGEDAAKAFAKNDLVEGIVPVIVWPGRFFLPAAFWLGAAVSALRILQVILRRDWRAAVAHGGGEVS